MNAYRTYEQAEGNLISDGFIKYQSCIDGATLYSKDSKVDDFYGGYAKRAICRIRFNYVDPIWGSDLNYYSIEFI